MILMVKFFNAFIISGYVFRSVLRRLQLPAVEILFLLVCEAVDLDPPRF